MWKKILLVKKEDFSKFHNGGCICRIFGATALKKCNEFADIALKMQQVTSHMVDLQAITDYPCDEILEPRTVLIANITPELEFHTPVEFFEDLKRLLGYKKCKTLVQADNIQTDLCEFNQYNTFCNYLDRID